jgi:2-polyprenyl-3-methyl-5-hydroxy-6-metoxy-1,4-benzoquinol methylase
MNRQFRHSLLSAAARPYRRAGRFAWHFAKGKLGRDPVFFGMLEHGVIPDSHRLIDLGCGQGLLASWLPQARLLYEAGNWPDHWPAPPKVESIWGLELMPSDIERARTAVGDRAQFSLGDICTTDFGKADVVVIMDVLHYIDYAAQEDVLRRVREALPPGGLFLTRIGDAAGGLPFHLCNWVDRTVFFMRGHRLDQLYCRTLSEWQALLARHGFAVTPLPMSRGTPFANVMLIAHAV